MNFCLDRLFRAARHARPPLPSEAPFLLETRVMAAWREGLPAERSGLVVPLVRKAVVGACAILVVSTILGVYAWRHEVSSAPDELITVESAIQLTMMQ
jgi:hypothetical protein